MNNTIKALFKSRSKSSFILAVKLSENSSIAIPSRELQYQVAITLGFRLSWKNRGGQIVWYKYKYELGNLIDLGTYE